MSQTPTQIYLPALGQLLWSPRQSIWSLFQVFLLSAVALRSLLPRYSLTILFINLHNSSPLCSSILCVGRQLASTNAVCVLSTSRTSWWYPSTYCATGACSRAWCVEPSSTSGLTVLSTDRSVGDWARSSAVRLVQSCTGIYFL